MQKLGVTHVVVRSQPHTHPMSPQDTNPALAQTVIDLSPAWVRSLINQQAYGADTVGRERSLLAVRQLTVKVSDLETTDLLSHLPEAVDFVSNAIAGGGTCLVHCMAGVSRSPTVRPQAAELCG